MTGSITGGWEFVWAAYVITWSALALYGVSLVIRDRKERRQQANEESEE